MTACRVEHGASRPNFSPGESTARVWMMHSGGGWGVPRVSYYGVVSMYSNCSTPPCNSTFRVELLRLAFFVALVCSHETKSLWHTCFPVRSPYLSAALFPPDPSRCREERNKTKPSSQSSSKTRESSILMFTPGNPKAIQQ